MLRWPGIARVGWLVALVGCYRPAGDAACTLRCAGTECPGGQECGSDHLCHTTGQPECSGAGPIDAVIGPDGSGDGGGRSLDGGVVCYGTGLVTICIQPPTMDLNMTAAQPIDTSVSANCTFLKPMPTGSELCVIAARDLHVLADVTAYGSRPLVLLAAGQLEVGSGTVINVSSNHTGTATDRGAGAPTSCVPAAEAGGSSASMLPAAGGAGGSFGGGGGAGGTAPTGHTGGLAGGSAGTQIARSVSGGCPGGNGGASGAGTATAGAYGGGAVYLIAGSQISIAGTINASGAGGWPPPSYGGGAGGGAGGFIGLDAPSYAIVEATLFAIGGGGSSGGGVSAGGAIGQQATGPGPTPPATGPAEAGTGGTGTATMGGTGGDPPTSTGPPGTTGGAGGGGGGGGYIGIAGTAGVVVTSANVAPTPGLMP